MKTRHGKAEKGSGRIKDGCARPRGQSPVLSAPCFYRVPRRSWHPWGTSVFSTHSWGHLTWPLVCIAQPGTLMARKKIKSPSTKHSKGAGGSAGPAQALLVAPRQQPAARPGGQWALRAGVLPCPGSREDKPTSPTAQASACRAATP